MGIASCYYNRNYGSMLQAYATQKIINKIGHQAITIQCLSPINYMTQSRIRYYIHKITEGNILKSKIRQVSGRVSSFRNKNYRRNRAIRNKKFDDFYMSNIHLSGLKENRAELTEFASNMDAVVVGSDMLWHPINIEHDYFTLTFVPNEVKKISYATSFGTTVIPKYQKKSAKAFLDRFDAISVREDSGLKVLENLGVVKSARVVLDPTLLFTANDWDDVRNDDCCIDQTYILCYFLGVNKWHREIANNLRKQTGYKIVMLPHLDEYIFGDDEFGDYQLYNVGPSELLGLIKNARFVLTDSFHGTCFSVLYHKQFLTFNRFMKKNTQSTNTRIDSLLRKLNLEERRVISPITNVKEMIEAEIDFSKADKVLEKMRNISVEYLKASFKI